MLGKSKQVLEELHYFINQEIDKLNFPKSPSDLYTPIEYTISLGGKRIRPILCLLVCKMFNTDVRRAINQSIAIELFHNFTLIHDDIMDDALLRRGELSVYKKWGLNTAILSGDIAMIKAYNHLVKGIEGQTLKDILNLFNTTSIKVCEGQQLDFLFETQDDVTVDDYLEMIYLKTASLLGCSLVTGAILSGVSENMQKLLYSIGTNVGLAFQLKDDLLDVYGDHELTGKKIGQDIVLNKKTFLFLKAMEKDVDGMRKYAKEKDETLKIKQIISIYNTHKIKDITEQKIQFYYKKAFSDLENIKGINMVYKETLRDLLDALIHRKK